MKKKSPPRRLVWMLAGLMTATAFQVRSQTNLPPLTGIAPGPFEPAWPSLSSQYHCPDWFRDAKFGIWAVYGPQCAAEDGDWYARGLYLQGNPQYQFHVAHYGHPSQFGFKDVIHEWKAENFHPDELLAFYRKNGAKYFMAMANHHDNFDMYNSKYQPWNSVALGPHKDIIGLWARAARKQGLRFAVSVHAAHAWSWYMPAQGADTTGALAGVPYDGKLTKADGRGLWWEGLDPQDLYAQNHPAEKQTGWNWWDWQAGTGSGRPDAAYIQKFYLRTKQLLDDYRPDMVYYDDTVLPLHGLTDEVGLRLAAHFYNSSIQWHGRNEAVMNGKHLDPMQRQAIVYDIERGKATGILPEPWQTDTCLGDWHYQRELFLKHQYKSAATVIHMLADIVSKNGNLMLSVPIRGDGTIDSDEEKIVSEIGTWLAINGEAIYGTRPWKVYGEGPATGNFEKGQFDGERDTFNNPFTAQDMRFTISKDGRTLFAIVLGPPSDGEVNIHSLAPDSGSRSRAIHSVRLLGFRDNLKFRFDENGLHIALDHGGAIASPFALKIQL